MLKILKNLIFEIKSFFFSIKMIIELKKIKPKFIFFSEEKSYQKFSKPIIDVLIDQYPNQIYYLSIDKNDKIRNERVRNYFLHYFLINFIFNNIYAENIFMTITDLDNHLIKKTKKINKYIYYFHSPNSTTKSYTTEAFDNYDIILCNGEFQIKEIKLRESLKNLNKKKLIPTGYFYLDALSEKINHNKNNNEILIAPSWNYQHKHFINENFLELLDSLLSKNLKVIFRPHPEHYKRSKKILEKIKDKFLSKNFLFDEKIENIDSMEKAKCLITDSSGIAIEYILTLKRPVLYLDEFDKVHNKEFSDYDNLKTIDRTIKENFGYLIKKQDFENIDIVINKASEDFKKKLYKLDDFKNNTFANFGNTKSYFAKISKEIL